MCKIPEARLYFLFVQLHEYCDKRKNKSVWMCLNVCAQASDRCFRQPEIVVEMLSVCPKIRKQYRCLLSLRFEPLVPLDKDIYII